MSPGFFVDESDLGLGKQLSQQWPGVVYPGHPDIPSIPRGSLDEDWLRVVGQMRLIVITRDRRIRYRPVEKQAWVAYRVRGFVLTGTNSQSTDQSLTLLARHRDSIEDTATERPQGPWMYAITDKALREIAL